jgi:hypothetical protein
MGFTRGIARRRRISRYNEFLHCVLRGKPDLLQGFFDRIIHRLRIGEYRVGQSCAHILPSNSFTTPKILILLPIERL